MTRAEFFDEVQSWSQLMDFCSDEGCTQFTEEIFDDDGRDDYINENLMDWARNDTWEELLSRLENIPTGYEYYEYDYGDWIGLDDDDFYSRRDEVADYCDANGIFDPEEDEDPEEDDEEEPDEEDEEDEIDPEDQLPVEEEDLSFDELFFAGISCVKKISEEERESAEEDERHFAALFA